jgi:hypothetical protein
VRPRQRGAAVVVYLLVALALPACGKGGGEAEPQLPEPPGATGPQEQPAPAADASSGGSSTGATDAGNVAEAKPAADPEELEAVVRAWSEALNAGDNDAAADLFAPGATVIQSGVALSFADRAAAVDWNASLPCSGTIVDLRVSEGIVIAVFSLGDRTTSPCDAPPGTLAAAAFLVEDGKIVVWQQIAVPADAAPEQSAAPREAGEPTAWPVAA